MRYEQRFTRKTRGQDEDCLIRIVFDSGIWKALQFGGLPRAALEAAEDSDEILFCLQIEGEVVRTLVKKFASSRVTAHNRISQLSRRTIHVVVPGLLSGACRDPKDDFVLECAVLGKADLIVTGDKDLLSLQR